MKALWTNIFSRKDKEETLSYFLRRIPIFQGLRRRELRMIEPLLHVRPYKIGEVIFEESDPGSGMYFVRSGKVEIFMRLADGSTEEYAMLTRGDFFGETALVIGEPRTASARAVEPTELVGFFRSDLDYIMENYSSVASRLLLNLLSSVCRRLQVVGKDLRVCRYGVQSRDKEYSSEGSAE